MRKLVVYSSRSGNTEKLARAIAEALGPECVLSSVADAPSPEGFDFIAFGFGVYRGWPDGDLHSYMRRARPRSAGIFLTLGAGPESDHAKVCLGRAEGLISGSKVVARFICAGGYAPDMVERMKRRPADSPHGWNASSAARVAAAEGHPDAADLAEGAGIFRAACDRLESTAPAEVGKTARLAVWFGSTVPSALAAYDHVESEMLRGNEELPPVRVFTSPTVRRKWQGKYPSLPAALQELCNAGVRRIRVLSGVLSVGEEYARMLSDLEAFRNPLTGFDAISATVPPLSDPEHLAAFIDAVASTADPETPTLFMGHGHADGRTAFAYQAAAQELAKRGPAWFLGCVEEPGFLTSLLSELKARNIRELHLRPFLLAAGDHACNDLAGEGEDSWKSVLERAGIRCIPELKGLGEYPQIADYFAREEAMLP